MQQKNYTMHYSRLKRAALHGFTLSGEQVRMKEDADTHFMVLPMLDSAQKGYRWGRFHLETENLQDCEIRIWAFARDLDEENFHEAGRLNQMIYDENTQVSEKRELFVRAAGIYQRNQTDILLYELRGQYLWIALEVAGEAAGVIKNMRIQNPGDNFMQTFPEVYQEEGGFFHRYMSVFSSIYEEVQNEIDGMENYLDVDKTPVKMLPVLVRWLGLRVESDFPDEAVLRRLLKEVYSLNKMKGTRWAVEHLAKLVLGEEIQVIEQNLLNGVEAEEKAVYQKLYGESRWDVTILVNRPPEEKLQEQFLYLVSQYKPVRCRIHLAFHQNCNSLDSYCFLDQNAKLLQNSYGSLEQGEIMDGSIILK